MKLANPTLDLAIKIRLAGHDATAIALKAQGALHRLADAIDLNSVFSMASNAHPKLSLHDAVTQLLAETELEVEDLTRFKAKLRPIDDAEKQRLAPICAGAVDRLFLIVRQLNTLENAKRAHHQNDAVKRKALEVAGFTNDQIDELVAPFDAQAAQVEADGLTAEKNALEGFLRHGDESLLPDGFEPVQRHKNQRQPDHTEIPASARPFLRAA